MGSPQSPEYRVIAEGSSFGDQYGGRRWYASTFAGTALCTGDHIMWIAEEPGARDCIVHNGVQHPPVEELLIPKTYQPPRDTRDTRDTTTGQCHGGLTVASRYGVSHQQPNKLPNCLLFSKHTDRSTFWTDAGGGSWSVKPSTWSVQMRINVQHTPDPIVLSNADPVIPEPGGAPGDMAGNLAWMGPDSPQPSPRSVASRGLTPDFFANGGAASPDALSPARSLGSPASISPSGVGSAPMVGGFPPPQPPPAATMVPIAMASNVPVASGGFQPPGSLYVSGSGQ